MEEDTQETTEKTRPVTLVVVILIVVAAVVGVGALMAYGTRNPPAQESDEAGTPG